MTEPSMIEQLNTALAEIHEQQRKLPMIVASASVIDMVRAEFPSYPEDRLICSPLTQDKAYVFDASLLDPTALLS